MTTIQIKKRFGNSMTDDIMSIRGESESYAIVVPQPKIPPDSKNACCVVGIFTNCESQKSNARPQDILS